MAVTATDTVTDRHAPPQGPFRFVRDGPCAVTTVRRAHRGAVQAGQPSEAPRGPLKPAVDDVAAGLWRYKLPRRRRSTPPALPSEGWSC